VAYTTHLHPALRAEERVELHLYYLYWAFVACSRANVTFTLKKVATRLKHAADEQYVIKTFYCTHVCALVGAVTCTELQL
jgi:hypothetical protein